MRRKPSGAKKNHHIQSNIQTLLQLHIIQRTIEDFSIRIRSHQQSTKYLGSVLQQASIMRKANHCGNKHYKPACQLNLSNTVY